MTKEEFKQKLEEITDNLNDQGKVTNILNGLYDEYEKVFDSNGELTSVNETLTTKNQELKDYNLELFMKVGKQDEGKEKGSLDAPDGKEEPKLKFEDLFNEKGEFK